MKRILIVNPFGIGDALFSMILARQVRRALPDCFIGFLCNERTCDLAGLDTDINRLIIFNRDHLRTLSKKRPIEFFRELWRLARVVRAERYDMMFDLSLGREFGWVGLLLGIPKRIGIDFKHRGAALTHRIAIQGYEERPVADYQLDLLNLAGIEYQRNQAVLPLIVSESDHNAAQRFLQINSIGAPKDLLLAIAPGGGRSWGPNAPYKQWPADYFLKVLAELTAGEPSIKVLLMGDVPERSLLEEIQGRLKTAPVIVCGLPIAQVCVLLKQSRLLICNDGGLLHLANALGVPTLSVFGPVDEKVYGCYGNQTPHKVLTQEVACRPCYRRFQFPACRNERRCLTELLPDKVLAEAKKMLKL